MVPRAYRGKLVLFAIAIFAAFMAYLMRRDLGLPEEIQMSRLPDIVVERLSFNRTISGREWRVTAEGAEREAGMIRARLVEVNVREGGKEGVSTLRANFGEFSEADSKVWLREVSGMIAHEGRSVDVAAPSVAYDSSKDTWFFSDGVTLSSDAAALAGGAAKINADGVFTIGKGARASWNIK